MHLNISSLKQSTNSDPLYATLDVQLERKVERKTKTNKPYLEIILVDATGDMKLKVWDNRPQFTALQELEEGALLRLSGEWTQGQYGIDSSKWDLRMLTSEEVSDFLIGDPETRQRQETDWNDILGFISSIKDPRLNNACEIFLKSYSAKFKRCAAARRNHHARRGGLIEHVAQMMRSADAVSSVYTQLNRDLLLAGVLFHDCGKMWENNYPEAGFSQSHNLHGEMLGHIPLGIETLNKIWRKMMSNEKEVSVWAKLSPSSEDVHIHLLHLVASHHGSHEWGSPTLPRTPEAMALHYIDNLDAKYEMMRMGYESAPELAPGIQERQFPLPANLITPLAHLDRGELVDSAGADPF